MTLEELARRVGGEVVGDGSVVLSGVSGIREAQAGHLTFLSNPKYERYLSTTNASAIVVDSECRAVAAESGKPLLVTDNAHYAFAKAMALFGPAGERLAKGVHPTAVVSESARIGADVSLGPHVVIMDGARIGDRVVLHAGVYVGPRVTIGRDTVVHSHVTIESESEIGDRVVIHAGTVVGSDGFGFAWDGEAHAKVPQIGNVVIEDDVEIGSNVAIDRATVGTTRIGRGTKIDNLVHIGHNVTIGENSMIVAQVGISGSTEVGKGVVLGGQAGVVGHIEIGDGAMVGAQAGVTRSVPAGERVSGYPARRHSLSKRLHACLMRLPLLFRRVKELERRIARLEKGE